DVGVFDANLRVAVQLGYVLAESGTVHAVFFTGTQNPRQFSQYFGRNLEFYSYESLLDGKSSVYNWPVLDETTAAALCYSTGTTGAPTGVVYSHRSIYLEALLL